VEKQTPQNCRWAEPTLFVAFPYWLESWERPWSCRRDKTPHVIGDADECASCDRWEPRQLRVPFGTE